MKMESAKTIEAEVVDGVIEKRDPLNNQLQRQATTPADLLQIAVSNGADIDKLEKLMELQMRWDANEAKKAYTRAMSQFRAGCPEIFRNKTVSFPGKGGQTSYTHADLAGAIGQIKSVLTECGLSHSWRTENLQGGFIQVTCILTHVDGHSEQTSMVCQPDNTGSKNAIQAMGSAVTYLQRYTLFAILGLASADDDDTGKPSESQQPLSRARQGQQARQTPQQESPPQTTTEPPKKPQSKEGSEKREFAAMCCVQATCFGLIAEGEKLKPAEYKSLLDQALQLAGTESILEATEWAIGNVTNMVRDEAGVRFIS